jgi:hypothetical protein
MAPNLFESNRELGNAVKKYCRYDATAMEEIACTYESIDKWDVSHVQDMSKVFNKMNTLGHGMCHTSQS